MSVGGDLIGVYERCGQEWHGGLDSRRCAPCFSVGCQAMMHCYDWRTCVSVRRAGGRAVAENPGDLDYQLAFVPESAVKPFAHLSRAADVGTEAGRRLVAEFVARFSGRVAGLVVHDKRAMDADLTGTADALRALGSGAGASDRPTVFLEYATGLPVDRLSSWPK